MRTKYILHGGFEIGKQDEDNSLFYSEILRESSQTAQILIVPFAKDEDRIIPSKERVMKEFNKVKDQKEISFELANKESFLKQLISCDIIYFQGGTTTKLLNALKEFPDFKNLMEGKIIAGESAGSNVLCSYFYSKSADAVGRGLGFLPLKIIPHYKPEYKDKFIDIGEELENLFLCEYEFKVFYI